MNEYDEIGGARLDWKQRNGYASEYEDAAGYEQYEEAMKSHRSGRQKLRRLEGTDRKRSVLDHDFGSEAHSILAS